jgi:hypothetical protein
VNEKEEADDEKGCAPAGVGCMAVDVIWHCGEENEAAMVAKSSHDGVVRTPWVREEGLS